MGDLLFGIDVMNVQDVIRYQNITKVPIAPALVRGLINLRGQIVTAIDLRERLNRHPRQRGRVSLLVDQISDVLELDGSVYESVPKH